MNLQRVTRNLLAVTAIAWGIPYALAEDPRAPQDPLEYSELKAQQDRAYAARVAADSAITAKVKTALLRERNLDSFDVSVETYKGTVLLSGFVKDDAQRRKAVQLAGTVDGVTSVKDGLALR